MESLPTFTNLLMQGDNFHVRMRQDLQAGLLRPHPTKSLPPQYIFDEVGSKLFEERSRHPDYHITRVEKELLGEHGADILRITNPTAVFEFGAGNCEKSAILLRGKRDGSRLAEFWPNDIDECILRETCPKLAREFPGIGMHAVVADFNHQLGGEIAGEVAKRRRGPVLYTYFGNTYGNFERRQRVAFLRSVQSSLFDRSGGDDYLLLGLDLAGEEKRMIAMYDSPLGRGMRCNIFRVLNRELGANFNVDEYRDVLKWVRSEDEGRVEMYFAPKHQQHVVIPPLAGDDDNQAVEVPLGEGEPMLLSISTKFTREGVGAEMREAGMQLCEWFTDEEGRMALALAKGQA